MLLLSSSVLFVLLSLAHGQSAVTDLSGGGGDPHSHGGEVPDLSAVLGGLSDTGSSGVVSSGSHSQDMTSHQLETPKSQGSGVPDLKSLESHSHGGPSSGGSGFDSRPQSGSLDMRRDRQMDRMDRGGGDLRGDRRMDRGMGSGMARGGRGFGDFGPAGRDFRMMDGGMPMSTGFDRRGGPGMTRGSRFDSFDPSFAGGDFGHSMPIFDGRSGMGGGMRDMPGFSSSGGMRPGPSFGSGMRELPPMRGGMRNAPMGGMRGRMGDFSSGGMRGGMGDMSPMGMGRRGRMDMGSGFTADMGGQSGSFMGPSDGMGSFSRSGFDSRRMGVDPMGPSDGGFGSMSGDRGFNSRMSDSDFNQTSSSSGAGSRNGGDRGMGSSVDPRMNTRMDPRMGRGMDPRFDSGMGRMDRGGMRPGFSGPMLGDAFGPGSFRSGPPSSGMMTEPRFATSGGFGRFSGRSGIGRPMFPDSRMVVPSSDPGFSTRMNRFVSMAGTPTSMVAPYTVYPMELVPTRGF